MSAARLTIDLDALAANWQRLDRLNAGETAATVKADGYGLGAEIVARRLAEAGVRSFFVALAEEGQAVRRAVGAGPRVYVFSGHMAGDAQLLRNLDLIPLLNSPEQAQRHFETIPKHPFGIQLDTGMNRLGLEPDAWRALREPVVRAGPLLVMSHLAAADVPDDPMNRRQREAFGAMTAGLSAPRSLAATGGILLGRDYHFDLARPGIGLYGGMPFADAAQVVSLSLPVIQTRTVETGEIVGYNGTWQAARPTRVATVAAGYADGLLRSLSNAGTLWAADRPCPILGRVSMDLITVDVTDLPEVPEALEVLNAQQTVDRLAAAAGTIGYEILTGLGGRYRRVLAGAAA